jgi:6-bladed beta-propeller
MSLTGPRSALFATVLLTGACGTAADDGGITVEERDSAGVAVVEIVGDVRELPEWSLGAEPLLILDGGVEPYFSNIGETEWLSDGRIVVEDNLQDALYLFDTDGTYVRSFGDKGDGPGQYQNITEITVLPGDSIYVYDRTHDRLSVVHPDVGFVRSIQYGASLGDRPPLDVFAIGPDRILVQHSAYDREDEGALPRVVEYETRLFLTDGSTALIDGPVAFPGGISVEFERGSVGGPYSHRAIVAVAPGRLVHGSGLEYDLTVRDSNLRVLRVIRWDGWTGPIPEAEMTAMMEGFDESDTPLPPDMMRSLREALFSPSLQPDVRPALSWRSYIDETGRIWLSKFYPSQMPDVVPEWHVLSAEGRPLGRLMLPAGSTLAAVSDSTVLIIMSDEFDVPSVHMYEIVRQ